MEPSDEALVVACQRGDTSAWEALIMRYQRLVYAIPYRAGLSEDHAADVFQHVFVALLENIDSIENPARIGAWLATTARRESWRLSRRAHSLQRFVTGDDAEETAAELPDTALLPDEVLLRLEAQHQVRTAVAALDKRCQQLLALLFYRPDPPAYSDIAAALGVTEGSIGPTRARCLDKLRRRLEIAGN